MNIYYIYETFFDLSECNISRNNHITENVQPSNCCVLAYMASGKKFGDPCFMWISLFRAKQQNDESGPKHKESCWTNLCMCSWLMLCLCNRVSVFCGYVFAFGASINFEL